MQYTKKIQNNIMMDRVKPCRRLSLTFAGSIGDLDISNTIEDIPIPFDDIESADNLVDMESISQNLNIILDNDTKCSDLNQLNFDFDEFSTSLANDLTADSSMLEVNDYSVLISELDEWITDDEKKEGKPLRRNSLLVAGRISKHNSLVSGTNSNNLSVKTKMQRRDSFLVAKDILGLHKDSKRKEKKGKRSRRNSLLINNKAQRRNSFVFAFDSLDLPEIKAKDRRNSLLLASKILGLQNEVGDKNVAQNSVLNWKNLSLKERRNSLLLASKIMGLQSSKESTPSVTNKALCEENSLEKKKRKSNPILDILDSSMSSISISHECNSGDRPRKRIKRRLSVLNALRYDPISSKHIPKNSLAFQLPILPKKVENCESNVTSIAQSACSKLLSLGQAMKSSEESQIRIHDWDRKMGLRRSHSKTMRNSMRSRKRLLQVCSGAVFSSMLS